MNCLILTKFMFYKYNFIIKYNDFLDYLCLRNVNYDLTLEIFFYKSMNQGEICFSSYGYSSFFRKKFSYKGIINLLKKGEEFYETHYNKYFENAKVL